LRNLLVTYLLPLFYIYAIGYHRTSIPLSLYHDITYEYASAREIFETNVHTHTRINVISVCTNISSHWRQLKYDNSMSRLAVRPTRRKIPSNYKLNYFNSEIVRLSYFLNKILIIFSYLFTYFFFLNLSIFVAKY